MSLTREEAVPLWTSLAADEHYAEVTQYIVDQQKALRDALAAFRDGVATDLSPEALATLNDLVEVACHPPPGCGG